jgi:hypothetical protein
VRGTADRLGQLAVGRVLEHKADRAGVDRVLREGRVRLHSQHDDLGRGRPLAQPADRVDARAAQHAQIEHQHVRVPASDLVHHGREVLALRDYADAAFAIEHPAQAASHRLVIVAQDHADHLLAQAASGGSVSIARERRAGHRTRLINGGAAANRLSMPPVRGKAPTAAA